MLCNAILNPSTAAAKLWFFFFTTLKLLLFIFLWSNPPVPWKFNRHLINTGNLKFLCVTPLLLSVWDIIDKDCNRYCFGEIFKYSSGNIFNRIKVIFYACKGLKKYVLTLNFLNHWWQFKTFLTILGILTTFSSS